MATGAVITKGGKNQALNMLYNGTATNSKVSQFKIGTGTTTPAETDTTLETAITSWTGGNDEKNFVSGFPTFNTTDKKVTTRGFVTASEANGNSVTEAGEVNTDGTPVLFSHDVFTAITKTATIQISFIWVHQMP